MFDGRVKNMVVSTTAKKTNAFEMNIEATNAQLMLDRLSVASDVNIKAGNEKYDTNDARPFDSVSDIRPKRPEM